MDRLPQQDVYDDNPREEVAPFVPDGITSALEVGCGKGGFGRTLRRLLGPECRIVGVEAVPAQAEVARGGHGFDEVIDGYFPEALNGSSERFDAVFFNDVLEHIYDPWSMLAQVHGRLQPRGHVLAAIPSIQYAPAVRNLIRGHWDYTDSGILDRTHVRFFTRATMVEMFEQAGFRVDECVGVNSVFTMDWPERALKQRLLLRLVPDAEWLHFVIVATSARP